MKYGQAKAVINKLNSRPEVRDFLEDMYSGYRESGLSDKSARRMAFERIYSVYCS